MCEAGKIALMADNPSALKNGYLTSKGRGFCAAVSRGKQGLHVQALSLQTIGRKRCVCLINN
ncbi:hypothetical protein HCH_03307 [Hahella chejuensis KCTC 2396]|uniref:Uncharacterized protein n=1 Tax=Hahella chejuensis (strain KCTC 2396) TaxID=349521 RepID=Q2SH12_HAHCH|nr:hypothetical protein HCH_03307 [Hahella chejuensis KCTC 2396]